MDWNKSVFAKFSLVLVILFSFSVVAVSSEPDVEYWGTTLSAPHKYGSLVNVTSSGEYTQVLAYMEFREEGDTEWEYQTDSILTTGSPTSDSELLHYETEEDVPLDPNTTYEHRIVLVGDGGAGDSYYFELDSPDNVHTTSAVPDIETLDVLEKDATSLYIAGYIHDLYHFEQTVYDYRNDYDSLNYTFQLREEGETEWDVNVSVDGVAGTGMYDEIIGGLSPGTSYEYRFGLLYEGVTYLELTDSYFADIKVNSTEDPEFFPGEWSVLEATNIESSSAVLNAYMEDIGDGVPEETTIYFQLWNLDDATVVDENILYGSPDTTEDYVISREVSGLEHNTSYEYSIWVEFEGEDDYDVLEYSEFTTLEDPDAPELIPGRLRNPVPFDGQGVTESFIRDNFFSVDVVSDDTTTCWLDIDVYDEDDNHIYEYFEEDICSELATVYNDKTILKVINREKGDYRVVYTLETVEEGDVVVVDELETGFRYGSFVDTLAGILGINFVLFRVLAGFVVIMLVNAWIYVQTRAYKTIFVSTVVLVGMFSVFGWFPDIVVVAMVFGLAGIFAVVFGRMAPSGL